MNVSNLKRALEISQALFDPDATLNCHVSVAFYKNKVVGIGQNQNKTDPINLLNKKFNRQNEDISGIRGKCSEAALFKLLKNKTNIPFNKIDIVNVRINRNKVAGNSCPCMGCASLLQYCEPKSVWFSNNDGGFEQYI